MKIGNLDSKPELWGFEKNLAVLDDGSMVFALELAGPDIGCASDDTINGHVSQLGRFFNALPSNIYLQFVQDIRGENDEKLGRFLALSENAESAPAKALAKERCEHFTELDREGLLPRLRTYLLVRRPLPKSPQKGKMGLLFGGSRYPQLIETQFKHEVAATEALKCQIVSELSSLGIGADELGSEDIARLFFEQWNPTRQTGDTLPSYDSEDVRSAFLLSDVSLSGRGFSIGGREHRIISLKNLPEHTIAGMSAALSGLPFGSRLFVSIYIPDQQKEIEGLQSSRRLAFSMAVGKKSGVADLESEAKLRDIETLLEELISAGEKVFRVSLNVVLSGDSAGELDERVSQTLLAVRNLAGAEAMEESFAAFPIFCELSIPNAKGLERSRKLKTSNLTDLVPIFAPWKGHENPSILLRGREGSLLAFDPFDASLTNYNQLISGGSGAGKSFLTNLLLLQMLKENPKVFFVDIGGSYKKLCENLDGQYLPLGVGNGLSLNPFDLGADEETPSSQKIKFLVSLVELMTKEEGDVRLPKLDRSEIEDAIVRTYEANRRPRLSHLRELLAAHENPDIRRYGRILNSWCGETPFGRFVDQETNVSLNRPLVSFDLKGMENFPELQSVCLFIITDFVWREVAKDRSTKKFLVFDECWKLLKNEAGLVFIEEVFRTFRKYRASATAISQDMEDFARSKIASAILPNCSVKWLLMQNQIDFERLKESLSLNENEIELVKSLRQKKGEYSEAFLMAQDKRSIAVVGSTPLEYWIATTDPKDLGVIELDQKAHPERSEIERLEWLAKQYPRGSSQPQATEEKRSA